MGISIGGDGSLVPGSLGLMLELKDFGHLLVRQHGSIPATEMLKMCDISNHLTLRLPSLFISKLRRWESPSTMLRVLLPQGFARKSPVARTDRVSYFELLEFIPGVIHAWDQISSVHWPLRIASLELVHADLCTQVFPLYDTSKRKRFFSCERETFRKVWTCSGPPIFFGNN